MWYRQCGAWSRVDEHGDVLMGLASVDGFGVDDELEGMWLSLEGYC